MGFFTSLIYYRPDRPPVVTGTSFARFLERLIETKLTTPSVLTTLKIKFGRAIDQGRIESTWFEMLGLGIGESREIEWDLVVPASAGFAGLLKAIAENNTPVYRAYAFIGGLAESARNPITVERVEDSMGFWPDGLSISLGPVRPSNLQTTNKWLAGWIEMGFSGNGYLYPCTLPEIVSRAAGSPAISRLCGICRSTWPVPSRRPTIFEVRKRKKFRELWPYDDLRRPYEWYWSVNETG